MNEVPSASWLMRALVEVVADDVVALLRRPDRQGQAHVALPDDHHRVVVVLR